MLVSIDRIDEGIAVLIGREDEKIRLTLPVRLLPPGSREGDILTLLLEADPAGTRAVYDRSRQLINTLKKEQ